MKDKGWIGTATKDAARTKQGEGQRGWLSRALGFGLGLVVCVGALVYSALADPAPVLTITPIGSNQFNITITNATSPTNYLLYWTPALTDTNYPWEIVATNATGETNFAIDVGGWPVGFFKVLVGDGDEDGDGVPAWLDAQPQNGAVGVLAVTIDSPINGSTLY